MRRFAIGTSLFPVSAYLEPLITYTTKVFIVA
nr:MAG TPA: hypothetical protein [Crassvirales sp.]